MAIIFGTAFCICTNDYNPFRDYRNAHISILSQSFNNLDSLEIFCRESLMITVNAPNLVDSVIIRNPSNIEFNNGQWSITCADSPFISGLHPVYFTFFDTGMQLIEFLTYRSNGDVVRTVYQCFLKSPLAQKTITANLGDTVKLFTSPVKRDVLYEWNIGGNIIKSTFCSTSVVIKDAGRSGKGSLRAYYKSICSPAVEFDYKFTDLLAPEIALLPFTYTVCGDTVKTSEKTFYFTLSITDRGGERIDSASINGMRFDKIQNNIYTKIFYALDTLSGLIPLSLYASDYYIYRNVATARYYLKYDSQLNSFGGVRVSVISPSDDSSRATANKKEIFIKLDRYTESFKDVKVVIESNSKDTAVEHDSIWIGTASLKLGTNSVCIKAVSGNTVLDSVIRIITYDTSSIDDVSPVILEIRADGQIIKKKEYSSSRKIVEFEIIAFDEASGVSAFMINNNVLPTSQGKYLWKFTDTLSHQPQGDTFLVKVSDKKGNTSERDFVIFYNRPPVVLKKPKPPRMLVIGDTYIDTIKVQDDDGDPVSLSMLNSGNMTISSKGVIHYKPDKLEKGVRHFSIEADDGYGKSLIYTFDILVLERNEVPKPVRFLSTEQSLPELIVLGSNLLLPLVIDSTTGMLPFTIKIVALKNSKILEVNNQNSTLTLGPFYDTTEIGDFPCIIVVEDSLLTSDTLFPVFKMVKMEKGMLKLTGEPSYYRNGIIDLRNQSQIFFKIYDPLRDEQTKYSVSVRRKDDIFPGPVNISVDTFSVTLSADSLSGFDTLIVCADNMKSELCCTLAVYYGNPPDQIVLSEPVDSEVVVDTNIVFSWEMPADQGLVWELHYGLYPVMDKKVAVDTGNCILKIKKSGLYGWKIVATEGKRRVESETRLVQITNPSHIRFDHDKIKINTQYEVQVDTISVNLAVRNRSVADSAYHCWLTADRQNYLPVINGKLKYLPQLKDTGWQTLVATVSDEAGNCDTFRQMIKIYRKSDLRCEPIPVAGRKMTSDGAFDLSHKTTVDTFIFNTGRNPDSVKITLLHSKSVVKNEGSNKIMVIIDPGKAVVSRDTMRIYLREGSDIQDYFFTFYYGTAPFVDSAPVPDSGSFKAVKLDTLEWSFGDIDNDSLNYDLYFGKDSDPIMIAQGLKDSRYIFSSSIEPGVYYWKVAAHDGRFSAESPVWKVYVNTYIININTVSAGLTGDLFNIPLLIRFNSEDAQYPHSLQSVNFRKENGAGGSLPFEIDFWKVGVDSGAAVWVLMDTIKAGSTQNLLMQIGGDGGLTSNGNIVFDTSNGFKGVWHLQDDMGVTNGKFMDATINNISGDDHTLRGRIGLIGYGQGFGLRDAKLDSTGDYIKFDKCMQLGTYTDYISGEAWVSVNPFAGEGIIFTLKTGANDRFKISVVDSGYLKLTARSGLMGWELLSSKKISDGNWHNLGCAVDYSSKELSIFIDGVKDRAVYIAGLNNVNSATTIAMLGSDPDGLNYFEGYVDELRISHRKRSQDWMKFCYENQRQNSNVVKVIKP